MSSSSATHDTVSRQPPWRGVASPTYSLCRLFCWHWLSYFRPSTLAWPLLIRQLTWPTRPMLLENRARVINTSVPSRTRHTAPVMSTAAFWNQRSMA